MTFSLISAFALTLPVLSAAPQEGASAVTANNQFAFDLYGRLASRQGSLFFSPYSITKALAMAYAGARGDTEREMASVLHFTLGQQRQHRAFLEMRKVLNRNHPAMTGVPASGKPIPQLWVSANLWGQRGYGFAKNYLNLLHECYGADLQEIDFADSEQARKTINDWAEKQTNHRIQNLLAPRMIHPASRLVLASAIYFKGDWASGFDKSATRPEIFQVNAHKKILVPMMHGTEKFGYFENQRMQGLRMPYAGENLAMLVLLPKQVDGLAALEKALTADKLKDWRGELRTQEVEVTLPKFRMTDEFALKDTLMALGMHKAFESADFSGMYDGREPFAIGAVTHKAFVEVNETGTEAAAATAVTIAATAMPPSMPPPPIPVFRADHPFLFAICDMQTGLLLFLGRVTNP
ncbi:MAG TPA: serpin family protein [Gemmataceae bacterium]|nr:serpin family protein [Gemmataceae bacterium]